MNNKQTNTNTNTNTNIMKFKGDILKWKELKSHKENKLS